VRAACYLHTSPDKDNNSALKNEMREEKVNPGYVENNTHAQNFMGGHIFGHKRVRGSKAIFTFKDIKTRV
jgi:hypothetical protein